MRSILLGPLILRRAIRLAAALLSAAIILVTAGRLMPLSRFAAGTAATHALHGTPRNVPRTTTSATGPKRGPLANSDLLRPLETVPTTRKVLALTFDISWGKIMPPKVVSILKAEHVPATFFLSGPWIRANAAFVRSMAQVPSFELESHGEAHVNFSGLGEVGVIRNLQQASNALFAVTGRRPTMVRPPNGDYNRASVAATASLGLRTVIWGTDSLDWMNPGVGVIISRVVKRAHPGDIVLLHASDTCKETDLALPVILKDLRAKGYTFVTVAELLKDASGMAGAKTSTEATAQAS